MRSHQHGCRSCAAQTGRNSLSAAAIEPWCGLQFFVLTDKRPGAPRSLPAVLDRYNDIRPFGGLVVAWIMFGSSGHLRRPKVRALCLEVPLCLSAVCRHASC